MEKHKTSVILVGMATCGMAAGAREVMDALTAELKKRDIDDIDVKTTGCIGICKLEPIIDVIDVKGNKVTYVYMTPEKAAKVVEQHIVGGKIVEEYTEEGKKSLAETDFLKGQTRIALRNCGVINPESIDEYIARDGYKALEKALTQMTPGEVIEEIKKSGLRGRGGGGFPTGLKWEFAANYQDDCKYVCCNADEGDPGAFMDRSILEGDPHGLLEAMAIAGYAVGSNQGYIYVRSEYPTAVKRLEIAISQAKEKGMIGENIMGTDFCFDIEIRLGAGAFVCGEETALLASIEGKRGEARTRPPFPAEKGLWTKPTLINNVESFANVPVILLKGAEWFSKIGTERSKGTKVFALGGRINNTGLVEIPMGTTLREVVYDIGGGIPGKKSFKAAQTGGPSGGCIPTSHIDTHIDYDSLIEIGCMMGSGGLIVMDETSCMVDIAKFFLQFTVDESCGKCTPCRLGTRRMMELLEKITEGRGEEGDIEELESLAYDIKNASLCGLGQTAPNPVLSTIRYFRDEYEAHIKDKKCPAGSCKALIEYLVIPDRCKKCGICAKHCPVDAISGDKNTPYLIDQSECIKCGICYEKCPFGAIKR
jgi:NADP-reducing hydrogenase subunit HndC